jgi:DNA-3-methyladenine glycosylase II
VDNPSPESDLQQFIALSLERLLGLRVDLSKFYRFTAKHGGPLEDLAQRFRGCKPPRFTSIFESIINAIASQQVSRTVAILILNRLTVKYGAVIHKTDFPCYAFPTPEDLAKVRPGDLRELGFSLNKGAAITELAQSIAGGDLKLEELSELSDEKAIQRLCSLRGIGRWTPEYVLLRGFGRTHIFPSADAGVRHSLKLWLKISETIDYPMVHRILSNWHPYGGLVYFHLLLDRLSDAGYLSAKHSLASHKENPQ